ncbi:hypothetical protein D3C87_1603640 [compost metagenome]
MLHRIFQQQLQRERHDRVFFFFLTRNPDIEAQLVLKPDHQQKHVGFQELHLRGEFDGIINRFFQNITVSLRKLVDELDRKLLVGFHERSEHAEIVEKEMRAYLVFQCIEMGRCILLLQTLLVDHHPLQALVHALVGRKIVFRHQRHNSNARIRPLFQHRGFVQGNGQYIKALFIENRLHPMP